MSTVASGSDDAGPVIGSILHGVIGRAGKLDRVARVGYEKYGNRWRWGVSMDDQRRWVEVAKTILAAAAKEGLR